MTNLVGEAATLEFAAKFAGLCKPPLVIYLQGDLGTGKTTFARGLIRAMGYEGNVKSPTFSLVEIYEFEGTLLYHFDLYRLNDPLELEFTGIRDLAGELDIVCLIEWPERGGDEVPAADLVIHLEYEGDSRNLQCKAISAKGQAIIGDL